MLFSCCSVEGGLSFSTVLSLYLQCFYGGTSHFITEVLTKFGIEIQPFAPGESAAHIQERAEQEGWGERLAMVHIETPANPTNVQIDIWAMRELADGWGSEEEAFAFLNHLELAKLAVSLGSTESLAQHPASMTHAGIPAEERERMGITGRLLRLSVGVEHAQDLIWDLEQALEHVH